MPFLLILESPQPFNRVARPLQLGHLLLCLFYLKHQHLIQDLAVLRAEMPVAKHALYQLNLSVRRQFFVHVCLLHVQQLLHVYRLSQ